MKNSRLNFAAIIKERVSSREMLESVGIRADRHGMARCPFHGDKDASLKIYTDRRRGWHCYGCNTGGDVTDFAMMWYGVGFREAVEKINDMFSLGLPVGDRRNPREMREIRAEIQKKREEQAAREKAVTEAENAFFAAFERWLHNDQVIRFERPSGPQEPMSEAFIYAVTHSAEIRDELDMAEERRWSVRASG